MMKRKIMMVLCLLAAAFSLTACVNNLVPEDNDDVEAVFEQDYSSLDSIVVYLLSLEEDRVRIHCNPVKILGEFGEPMEFNDTQVEQLVNKLADKGYHHITKENGVIAFDVWRKPLHAEFEAGFVYSDVGSGAAAAVAFITLERPLAEEKWYYYESDYNEWRARITG